MLRVRTFLFIAILAFSFGGFANYGFAVNPDEMLENPLLEKRARDLSEGIRCMVCQNQSIDDSDAAVARDLRLLIRERISAGESDTQVVDYLVSRFGEFILLKPRFSWSNALLWMTPGFVLLCGLLLALKMSGWLSGPASRSSSPSKKLNKKEQGALTKILGDRE